MWSPSLHTDTSGTHLQTQKSMQNTSRESGQEDLTSGKECVDPRKTGSDEGTRGKIGVLIELALLSAGGGAEAGVRPPCQGNCLSQKRNI